MAEPARSPSASRRPRLSAVEALGSASIVGLNTLMVQDIPKLPSLAALHALTDHDLPSTDGLPMPESMFQAKPLGYTVNAVRRVLERRRSDVCVVGDLLVYDEGRPDADGRVLPAWIAPDVLVAFGVENRDRNSYVIWQEGKSPDFVMEIASTSAWKQDRDKKPAIYASLGVEEYFLFDVMGGLLEPRLQGHGLRDGAYQRLGPELLSNEEWGVRSRVLGLCAYLKGPQQELRWLDPESGMELEDFDELHDARDAAEARAAEEAAARNAAEADAAELRAEVQRLRRGQRT